MEADPAGPFAARSTLRKKRQKKNIAFATSQSPSSQVDPVNKLSYSLHAERALGKPPRLEAFSATPKQ
jgi:hypothetical protein